MLSNKHFIKFILSAVFLFTAGIAGAQKVTVRAEESEIDKMQRKGMATTIELDKKTVERAWLHRFRELGKYESKSGIYTIKSQVVPAIAATPVTIISRVDADVKGTTIFWAIDLGSEYAAQGKKEFEEAKKLLHEFAVQVYRDDLNRQIEEADKAVDGAVRQHDKLQESGLALMKQIERNQTDNLKLQQQMMININEKVQLKTDSAQNRLLQTTALEEIDKLRKISEEKKNKLSSIQ
ncbi:MAG: hypothetical protein V4543_10710 [Bacteroidota bacterium]